MVWSPGERPPLIDDSNTHEEEIEWKGSLKRLPEKVEELEFYNTQGEARYELGLVVELKIKGEYPLVT